MDARTPDSAGTTTAMVSGIKSGAGVIGVDEDVVRGDCSTVFGNEVYSAIELAEIKGLASGIGSTARITHTTPAATYARSADRNREDVSDMPEETVAAGCEDVASQLVTFESSLEARFEETDIDGLDVVVGGGRRHFLPKDAAFNSIDAVSSTVGDRTDGVDLTAVWKTQYPHRQYVIGQVGFDAVDSETTPHLFALFNESHLQYEQDRHDDIAGEPSLTERTSRAIAELDNNDKGLFLTVESGRIDHAHHAGNAHGALIATIEFSNAIRASMEATNPAETLIFLTADHSHVFTIAGYPKRGNPIPGKLVSFGQEEPQRAADGMPYTTLGYMNGPGYRDLGN